MKMLVALDQSKFAGTVLEKAIAMAKKLDASLSIMTVAEDYFDIGDYLDVEADAQKYAAEAKAAGIEAEVIVEQGVSPADLIIAHAKNKAIDLVVVGHQGKKGLQRFLIGSVASRIATHAPCSVLVIR